MKIINGVLFILFTFNCLLITAAAQTGGTFDLSHSVIAGGGESNSTGGTFRFDGTVGQPAAGDTSSGATFNLRGGFWIPGFAPTAANATVSGRVTTAHGQGIRNVLLQMTSGTGEIKFAYSSGFGFYKFENLPVGQTYILNVTAKKFTIKEPTRVISLNEDLTNMDFVSYER